MKSFDRSLASTGILLTVIFSGCLCAPGSGSPDGGDEDGGSPPTDFDSLHSAVVGDPNDDWIVMKTVDDTHAVAVRAGRTHVWAIDPDLGYERWEVNQPRGAPAAVVGELGTIFVPGTGGDARVSTGFTGPAHLLALDVDGTLRWSFDAGLGAAASAPAVLGDRAYFLVQGILFAVEAGTELWRDDTDTWVSPPLLLSSGEIVTGSATTLKLVDAQGVEVRSLALDQHATVGAPATLLHDDTTLFAIVAGAGGGSYAFERADGALRWFEPAPSGGQLRCSCAVGGDGRLFLTQTAAGGGSAAPGLRVLSGTDGSELYFVSTAATPLGGSLGADGLSYYLVDEDEGLRALDPSGSVLWTVAGIKAPPAVRSADRLYAPAFRDFHALDGSGNIRWSWTIDTSRYSRAMQERIPPAVTESGKVLFSYWRTQFWPNSSEDWVIVVQDNDL